MPDPAGAVQQQPNIVLIVADDLGYADIGSHLGRYGEAFPQVQTPNLDAMAQEGMRLYQAYTAASVCKPSRVALMTGRYPQRLGFNDNSTDQGIPLDVVTLPEALTSVGYDALHIGKWGMGWIRPEFQPAAKNTAFFGFPMSASYDDPALLRNPGVYEFYTGFLTDVLTDEAVAFIEGSHAAPFFLSISYLAPHLPLEAPDRWRAEYPDDDQGVFRALISTLDENVGRVLDALAAAGLDQDTLVIFTSDNGGAFMSQDWLDRSNGPLRGLKSSTYEGGIRVPFLARWPGQIAAGSASGAPINLLDLFPTLSEAAGFDPTALELDGRSLLPFLLGGPQVPPATWFWNETYFAQGLVDPLPMHSVRSGNWKLSNVDGVAELHDLATDLTEQLDLAPQNSALVDGLEASYSDWRIETTRIPVDIELLGPVTQTGNAYDFHGGRARIPHHPQLDIGIGHFTLSIWIEPRSIPVPASLVGKGNAWELSLQTDGSVDLALNGYSFVLSSGVTLPLGVASHLVCSFTHDGPSQIPAVNLYIDGTLVASAIGTPKVARNPFVVTLGAKPGSWNRFDGILSDISFWAASLEPADIPGGAASPAQ